MRSANTWPVAAIFVAGFVHTARATAATLNVPADFPTIQSCIDAAVSGQDECVVAPGTYNELINFLGKAITLRSSHGPTVTTIDGIGLNGTVVTCKSGETTTCVLDGFTITGGVGGIDQYGHTYGGGLYLYYSSPTIVNNVVSGNINEDGYGGGGLYLRYSSGIISHNIIEDNNAIDDAGIFLDHSSPLITHNIIRRNFARGSAGGLGGTYCNSVISHNIIIGNRATAAGGIGLGYSSPLMDNNLIVGNSAEAIGGGILLAGSSPTIRNTTIASNYAGFGGGGAVYLLTSQTVLTEPIFTNTIVAFNSSAIHAGSSSNALPIFQFCDFRSNGQYAFSGLTDPTGTDGNISELPLFVRNPSDGGDGWGDKPSTPDIDEGANDDFGDLRVQTGSPCINAGDPDFVSLPDESDLDGHARVLCGRVDMGAYEFGIGDFDCNQTVNLVDLGAWDGCETGPVDPPLSPLGKGGGEGCEAFDFDGDGDVDLGDLAQFILAATP